ncbi:hypothetical protein DM01DRAFT_317228 [Hesseltinella vesiculosa]|uniref:Integrator complex subunit 10 n=1 Tax=Hesseltinella vesiculosa TaxID=101127 RepID=A0A1X2GDY0_9FUNG|nr:hypothetical protein DM01DRAFT_317228 [Hesseltinella vesiculosa]
MGQHIKQEQYEKATQVFVLLQSQHMDNPALHHYFVQIAQSLGSSTDPNLAGFFTSLPCLLQSNVIDFARDKLVAMGDNYQAFEVLFDYIHHFPRHAYKYIIEAVDLLIQMIENGQPENLDRCPRILATELFPRLCKQRLVLALDQKEPCVKSTESKHYLSIPYTLFENYILIGQRYYIQQRQWDNLQTFTCMMVSACGFFGFDRLDTVSHTIRFQYLKEHRLNLHSDDERPKGPDLIDPQQEWHQRAVVAMMCESMTALAQLVIFGYSYYLAVCGMSNPDDASTAKACLIPICALNNIIPPHDPPTRKRPAAGSSDPASKRRKTQGSQALPVPNRGQGKDAECMKGVDHALRILGKAGDCLRHLVGLWQWASSDTKLTGWLAQHCPTWDASIDNCLHLELRKMIDLYQMPFDVKNAVLLVQSDLALSLPSVPGNLALALELSQVICDRIEVERRKERSTEKSDVPAIPFMFAFRVLYNIAIIYLLVGSIQQSSLEIAIILSVFPIPLDLNEVDFMADEVDCGLAANVFQDREFGLMRVDQAGMVARCIKHLVMSLDSETEQKSGLASIDAAMRWDEKAGNMIVLMQYGWRYWITKTNMWHRIQQQIKDKRTFKNRSFLEYVYVEETLQRIQAIHEAGTTVMDIIPPDFASRGSYRHLIVHQPESPRDSQASPYDHDGHPSAGISHQALPTSIEAEPPTSTMPATSPTDDQEHELDDLLPPNDPSSAPPPIYQPTFANQIMPSATMSPSWYSASSQKNAYAAWMSPSFYYSRPATSVQLPERQRQAAGHSDQDSPLSTAAQVTKEIVSRCLEHRMDRYSPRVTPQRMRHVLHRFLKSMVLNGNSDV